MINTRILIINWYIINFVVLVHKSLDKQFLALYLYLNFYFRMELNNFQQILLILNCIKTKKTIL